MARVVRCSVPLAREEHHRLAVPHGAQLHSRRVADVHGVCVVNVVRQADELGLTRGGDDACREKSVNCARGGRGKGREGEREREGGVRERGEGKSEGEWLVGCGQKAWLETNAVYCVVTPRSLPLSCDPSVHKIIGLWKDIAKP